VQPGKLTQDSALTQAFVLQYVLARETFDATDLRENFRKVTLWSADAARLQYQRSYDRNDPASPLRVNAASIVVSTVVKSVSLLSPTTALVRFDTIRREAGATTGEQRSWAAVLSFRYSGAPMSMADRALNPLGFQVLTYRRDAEATGGATVRLDSAGNVAP
jgi:type IV secretion system protein VirB8